MNTITMIDAFSNLDDDLVEKHFKAKEALKARKAKPRKTVWLKWSAAVAACLCVVFVAAILFIPENTHYEEIPTIIYDGQKYAVVGADGESSILEKCGLPNELTADLAGELLGYLNVIDGGYAFTEETTNNKLFEYAPKPNKNVYILLIDNHYYAAIKWDNGVFIGLTD